MMLFIAAPDCVCQSKWFNLPTVAPEPKVYKVKKGIHSKSATASLLSKPISSGPKSPLWIGAG